MTTHRTPEQMAAIATMRAMLIATTVAVRPSLTAAQLDRRRALLEITDPIRDASPLQR